LRKEGLSGEVIFEAKTRRMNEKHPGPDRRGLAEEGRCKGPEAESTWSRNRKKVIEPEDEVSLRLERCHGPWRVV
jgi:hypothetical protein